MSKAPARPPARSRGYQRGPHLYRRGETWYARGGTLGRQGVSLHTSLRAEAERRFREHLRADRPVGGAPSEAPAERTLVEIADAWIDAPHGYTPRTKVTHRNRLIALGAWLAGRGATLPSEITPVLIDTWVTERSKTTSRATINRDLRTARVALRWAVERGLSGPVPALVDRDELREPQRSRSRTVPSPPEVLRILTQLEPYPRARAAIACLWLTGLRIEELRHLHAASMREGVLYVEPEAGAADTAWTSKGYRTRAIPLGEVAQGAVRAYLATAVGPRGRVVGERQLLTRLALACDRAQLPRCGLHDMRRAFATEASRAGIPTTVIARWLGHSAVATTERYLVAYRSDRGVVAPTPDGADSVQILGGDSCPSQPAIDLSAERVKRSRKA